jgi:class 3 adenylate cyclase/tetratricopeptide (TPR) repeat protein
MDFYAILDQVIDVLRQRQRVTYRALKRQFNLDDDYLEDVKAELIQGQRLAVDEDGAVLVWTGEMDVSPRITPPAPQPAALPGTADAPGTLSFPAPAVPPSPDAERRQLTVMFCDLVGSTVLSGQLDPEDLREVVRAYQEACAKVVARFEGHIAQYLGDGLLVYFGYPQAHEDDAQRAVRAGLGIVEAIGTLNTSFTQTTGITLAVRLGIHTGLVVVGAMGGGGRQEQLALGETPNIAARIEGLAAPNTVAISDATYRLVQGYFQCQDLGAQALRGVTESVRVYHVRGESDATSRLDVAQPRGLTPLVGRESEVTLLLERWEQVKAGQGHVVLLTGDAGIGKSRLVHMLKDHVANEPHMRWECRSAEYSQNTALFPLVDLFQRILQFETGDTPDEKLGKLEDALSQYRLPLEETVPLFAPLLSLSLPESRYASLNVSPQRQRQKTLETIIAILLELAERHPVLFILEDLHWTDPTTLELLNLVRDQTPTAAMLVLLTCRSHFQPSWHHRSYLTEITVNRLSHTQVAQIVTRMIDGKTFPAKVLQQIVEKTDGVPLFVEEVTKAILESGQLKALNGPYALTGALSTLAIPVTLQDSLMARLDRLVTAKAVAQYAAVIGRQFSYALLQAVSQLDEAMLQHELGRLVEAEIVYHRGVPPHATYMFKHALIQDAAYQSLLKSTRQQYHQRVAHVLAEQFPDTAETQPELLARHYTEAGLHGEALRSWRRAGELGLRRSTYREAVTCLEQALATLAQLPERRDTQEQAIEIRLALRAALLPFGAYGQILHHLREAETLAHVLDDRQRLVRVAVSLTEYFRQMSDHAHALESGQRALAFATTLGDVGLQVVAHYYLGLIYYDQGDYRRAVDCLGWNVATLRDTLRREHFGMTGLPFVLSCACLSWSLAELGRFTEGVAQGEAGVRVAEAADHPFSLINAYVGLGHVYLTQGDFPRGIPVLERGLRLCQAGDIPTLVPTVARALGTAYALSGRAAEALPLLEQGAAQGRRSGRALWLAYLREAYLLAGSREDPGDLAQRALDLSREYKQRGYQASALRMLGESTAHREPLDVDQAAAYYNQALALAEELGMRPLQAHCHRGLGTLYATIGQQEQARTELSAAIVLYRAMDMTFWLPQTEAALAQVE